MTGGKVLDTSTLLSFANNRISALLAIDAADRAAQTVVVPATALTSALVGVTPDQAESMDYLLDFGVVIIDELTRVTAPEVAATMTIASSPADLAVAHAAYSARSRGWAVITANARLWADTYPDIPTEQLP